MGFRNSLLKVASGGRSIMIKVNNECLEWISRSVVDELEKQLFKEDTRVYPSEPEPSSRRHFPFKGNNGVKNKITWWGPLRSWLLTFKTNDPNSLKDYLEKIK